MALTTVALLRLRGKGFAALFTKHEATWTQMARDAHDYVGAQLPKGQVPMADDIQKVLLPVIEFNPTVRNHLAAQKLTQKYWITDFTDYVIDRVFQPHIHTPEEE